MIRFATTAKLGLIFLSLLINVSLSSCTIDTAGGQTVASRNESNFFDFTPPKQNTEIGRDAIVSTAESINSSITQLEKIERYRKPSIISVKDENMKQYNLGHNVQVDWSGPIEPLMSEIAAYSDYRFKVVGIAPAIPVLVDIAHDNIPIGEVIREAHLQAKERANLVVYPKSKTIELRYNEIG